MRNLLFVSARAFLIGAGLFTAVPSAAAVRQFDLSGVQFTYRDFWRSDGHVFVVNMVNTNDVDACVEIRVNGDSMVSWTLIPAGGTRSDEYYVPREGKVDTQSHVKGAENGQCG